jgi:pyruvate formate lyase activating enzyme
VDETVETRLTERELFDFLDTRTGMLEGVVITGGEPTIHGDLVEIMREIKNRGFLVKLDSNGTHPEVLEAAIAGGLVDYIAMDIKSPLASYERIAARPVDAAAIQKSIALLLASPVAYEFRTTVIKGMLSPADLEDIGREIRGAKQYYLQKFVSTKILNPQFKKKVTYSDDEFKNFQKTLHQYVAHCGIR